MLFLSHFGKHTKAINYPFFATGLRYENVVVMRFYKQVTCHGTNITLVVVGPSRSQYPFFINCIKPMGLPNRFLRPSYVYATSISAERTIYLLTLSIISWIMWPIELFRKRPHIFMNVWQHDCQTLFNVTVTFKCTEHCLLNEVWQTTYDLALILELGTLKR